MLIIFGKRLRELRLEKGLKAKEFAEIFGITPQAITTYEKNNRFPDKVQLAIDFANYFNVSLDYILGLTNVRNYKDKINIDTIDPEIFNLLAGSKDYTSNQKYAIKAIIAGVKMVED